MKLYRLRRGEGTSGLHIDHAQDRAPDAHEVRVRMHAASLNYRDLLVAQGRMGTGELRVPLSDGVGEVVTVGRAVTRFACGDRVIPTFYPHWLAGPPSGEAVSESLGGNVDGVLSEYVIANEDALVRAPESLSWADASTIACAGVTAWHALFGENPMRAGDRVLIQGTGGVSTWALQLAVAARLRVIVLSGSDDKLSRARALGAEQTINYATEPEWDARVRDLTDGGVDRVLDIGGADTISRAIRSTRYGGTVATIGGVSGGFALSVEPFALIGRSLTGILVGSRTMAESLIRFVDTNGVVPVIDSVFPFDGAADAYARLECERPLGKVVIDISGGSR
ncbi:zinc-dependent alcohol dehydrogenase family protein [Lysobacter niastensis]|uniref:NAD(P)-dependent alcohol dehydrogenase n=1 Tax=Lysobacter niastensis TaxID=380629 RepID=A0ABS0B760_9GAMM|nr:NAD(P)-dependent alcohol dehydrogenase [Lysobacter niastensis]MBF6024853.1 NAD(P)-dependent alcohol dehydrogenase [Lysobacter niastensis]